jgi:ATP-dependent DNA ligase
MGLEGIVARHRERGYKAGPCKDWIKVKNPIAGNDSRGKEADW